MKSPIHGVLLPILAIVVFAVYLAAALLWSSTTFACDMGTYMEAARRFLDGAAVYGSNEGGLNACGVFQYPPPFVLLIVPFVLLPMPWAAWLWIAILVAVFVAGIALMPVRSEVRWIVLLLAGISWPFLYGVRIGQITPVLFFLFVIGWRSIQSPGRLGVVAALGTLLKVQPGLLFGWMLLRRDRASLVVGAATVVALSALAAVLGSSNWADFIRVQGGLSSAAYLNGANVAPAAVAYVAGFGNGGALTAQLVSTIVVLAIGLVACLRSPGEASYLTVVVASQLVSPILWTHYSFILLLPVAWLLERRHWWAALIPLSQAWMLLPIVPPAGYLVAYYVMLVAPPLVAASESGSAVRHPARVAGTP